MKKTLFIHLFYFLISISVIFSQTDDSWKIYDDTNVSRFDITIDTAKLNWIYNNVYSDSEHVASVRFRNIHFDETYDSIGVRLRGNTSRVSQKKSFKLSFNSFIKGRKFHNVEKINLNGEHNDPSIIRSKLCFDHFNKLSIPAPRASHTQVYINGKYYGLYINVEHIDEELIDKHFKDNSGNLWKCLYPADLTYKGSNPQTYINMNNNGTPVYELKTNESQMDFSHLVRLITILNYTPSQIFYDSLESVIDVSSVLKYFAINLLTGSWDDYWSNMNNYYLYHNPSEDKFFIIPYDYDNTFGIDWSNTNWTTANPYNFPKINSGARPLAEKIISNPTYRNLYTHFIDFFMKKSFQLNLWESRIDSIKNLITSYAALDSFRTKDYNFTMSDFSNSYSATGYSNKHVKYGIKQFVNLRNNSMISFLSYQSGVPIAYKISYEPKNPNPSDSIRVFVSAFSYVGLKNVSIRFLNDGQTTPINYPMNYSPITSSNNIDEVDRYVGIIPPLGINGGGKFSINLTDSSNNSQLYPRKGEVIIKTSNTNNTSIVINEFLADNVNSFTDPNGDHDDWIELYNPTENPILLTGKYLTDNPGNIKKWRFTQENLTLNPKSFLVVWCDEELTEPGVHSNFKLSKGGEFIALTDTNRTTILDSLSFGQQKTDTSFGRYSDGATTWKFLLPTPGTANVLSHVNDISNITDYSLSQNYPNPFNPETTIKYSLQAVGIVTIKLIDILGKELITLVNELKNAGEHEVKLNANSLSNGIYFYSMKVGNFYSIKKLVVLK